MAKQVLSFARIHVYWKKKFEVVVAWRKKSIAVGIMYYNKHARQIVRGKATRLEAWKRNAPTKRKNQN